MAQEAAATRVVQRLEQLVLCPPCELAAHVAQAGGLPSIMVGMAIHVTNRTVAQRGCYAIRVLAVREAVAKDLVAAGAVPAVLAALQAHSTDTRVVRAALAALRNITFDEDCTAILAAGSIELALASMRAHGDDAEAVEDGCYFLGNMCCPSVAAVALCRARVVELGGAALLLQLLPTAPAGVAAAALWALSWLALPPHRSLLRDSGAADVAVQTMARHAACPRVAEEGCAFFCRLFGHFRSLSNTGVEERASDDVIRALLAAMERHCGDTRVAQWGCAAICALAFYDDMERALVQAGGIPAVMSALALHRSSAKVAEEACWALNNLTQFPGGKQRAHDAGVTLTVLELLEQHRASLPVARNGVAALAMLFYEPKTGGVRPPLHAGRVDTRAMRQGIAAAMAAHRGDVHVALACCRTLRYLARAEGAVCDGDCDAVLLTLSVLGSDAAVTKAIMNTLEALLAVPGCCFAPLPPATSVDLVRHVMLVHSGLPKVVERASRVCDLLCRQVAAPAAAD